MLNRKHLLDELVVDTGSSNTWVGAGQTYIQTSTTQQTRDQVVRTSSHTTELYLADFIDFVPVGDVRLWGVHVG